MFVVILTSCEWKLQRTESEVKLLTTDWKKALTKFFNIASSMDNSVRLALNKALILWKARENTKELYEEYIDFMSKDDYDIMTEDDIMIYTLKKLAEKNEDLGCYIEKNHSSLEKHTTVARFSTYDSGGYYNFVQISKENVE